MRDRSKRYCVGSSAYILSHTNRSLSQILFNVIPVCRLSYWLTNLSELELPPPQMCALLLWDHIELYMSTPSSPSVETSFISFQIAYNFHFKISVSLCFLLLSEGLSNYSTSYYGKRLEQY